MKKQTETQKLISNIAAIHSQSEIKKFFSHRLAEKMFLTVGKLAKTEMSQKTAANFNARFSKIRSSRSMTRENELSAIWLGYELLTNSHYLNQE